MTDEVDWIGGGKSEKRHGRVEVARLGRETLEALEFQNYQPDEFIVGRDTAVVLAHEWCLVRASGRVVNANWAQIIILRSSPVCRFRECTKSAAWDAGFARG
jgi:hypothetical protein